MNPVEGGVDWFSSRHDPTKGSSGSVLRLLQYPAVAMVGSDLDKAVDIRAGAHSDYGKLFLYLGLSVHIVTVMKAHSPSSSNETPSQVLKSLQRILPGLRCQSSLQAQKTMPSLRS